MGKKRNKSKDIEINICIEDGKYDHDDE